MPIIFCHTGVVGRIGGEGRMRRENDSLRFLASGLLKSSIRFLDSSTVNLVLRYLVPD